MEKDVFRALQSCPLYENISDEDIMRSMKDIPYELVQYPKKAIYKKTGQPIEFADIIVSGEVNIKLESKTGKRATVISYGIGRIVAPSVIFSKSGIFPVTLEVSKPTTFLRMTPESLLKVMSRNKKIQQNFIRRLSSICYELMDTLKLITLHTVREKVAIFLLNESNRRNADSFTLDKSRQEIADLFAIQKFSLQRSLSEFADEGIIQVNGKSITILNRKRLSSIANL